MNKRNTEIEEARAALIEKNIDLAFRFLDELIDDPAKIGQVPSGATVYVAPEDDPAFAQEQTARAQRSAESGRPTYLWALGRSAGERSGHSVRAIAPHWPTEGIDPVGFYDRATDTLVVDFFRGRRAGMPISTETYGTIFVDPDTGEIVLNVLPEFLARAVPMDPAIIDVLLRPETTLSGITREEVAAIKNELMGGRAARSGGAAGVVLGDHRASRAADGLRHRAGSWQAGRGRRTLKKVRRLYSNGEPGDKAADAAPGRRTDLPADRTRHAGSGGPPRSTGSSRDHRYLDVGASASVAEELRKAVALGQEILLAMIVIPPAQ